MVPRAYRDRRNGFCKGDGDDHRPDNLYDPHGGLIRGRNRCHVCVSHHGICAAACNYLNCPLIPIQRVRRYDRHERGVNVLRANNLYDLRVVRSGVRSLDHAYAHARNGYCNLSFLSPSQQPD